jgi:hypothetical protein
MRTILLLVLLAMLPGMASAQQNPSPDQDKRSEGACAPALLHSIQNVSVT